MYFKNCTNLEDLKKLYRKLAMQNHPDVGGSEEVMKSINAEYALKFEQVKNVRKNASGEEYTTKNGTTEVPEDLIKIIEKLILVKGIELEIIGNWLWCYGETYPIKNILKELKFVWSNTKKAWAYHKDPYFKTSKKELTFDDIRELYGSKKFEQQEAEALRA